MRKHRYNVKFIVKRFAGPLELSQKIVLNVFLITVAGRQMLRDEGVQVIG